jgi:hypothetical protein
VHIRTPRTTGRRPYAALPWAFPAGPLVVAALLVTLLGASPTAAQTDFFNLDKDRPLRVEDALAGKMRGLELKVSPFDFSRLGTGRWEMVPQVELKAGILPGLEVSAGLHPTLQRAGGETESTAGSAELSVLGNLWKEGPRLPAAGLRITAHLPVERGEGADHGSYGEARGILTRSLGGPFRAHLNAAALVGDTHEQAWFGGAVDWVLPFHHTLFLAEGWRNVVDEGDATLHAGAGVRTQLSPTLVLDAGAGRDLSGPTEGRWRVRMGVTWEFGLPGWRGRPIPAEVRRARAASHATSPPAFDRVAHPFHLVAGHNRAFRDQYPDVDRLFNAFDYGHGVLYETLWTRPEAPTSLLEEEIFARLVEEILPRGPRMSMPESSFMPRYVQVAPRAHEMFEWAHVLHRQSYDILADPTLSEAERDRAMAELLAHYQSSDLAFPVEPKGMEIMDGQYFSKAFRERFPRFNGLIWAYHWLQVAIYEPLLVYDDPAERRAGVQATVARFWQMLTDPPGALPSEMPMTPAISPVFTERYPEFAAIFDNLHMMHDVVSDILVSDAVGRDRVRAELWRQVGLFLDPDAMSTSVEAWIAMALAHGVDAQGGPAVGWLPEVPTRNAHGGHDTHQHHHPEEDR